MTTNFLKELGIEGTNPGAYDGRWIEGSPFRARFEAKGRFAAYLQPVPVYVIDTPQSPAVLGAAEALDAALPMVGQAD